MAETDKFLAQRNKTCTGAKATNKPPAVRRDFLGVANIYHVPRQRYYDKTLINRLQGERWFNRDKGRWAF